VLMRYALTLGIGVMCSLTRKAFGSVELNVALWGEYMVGENLDDTDRRHQCFH
jgi:hypothetical protein